ncbi:MAG: response regulator [bacterium]
MTNEIGRAKARKDHTATTGAATRVLIVEDHPAMRRGLADTIRDEPDLTVCGEVGSSAEALHAIEQELPDVTLIDLSLGHESGLDLVKQLAAQHPECRMLVVSRHDEEIYAERSLQAGALGYVSKEAPIDQVIEAIQRVARGRVHLSPAAAERLLGRVTGRGVDAVQTNGPRFSDREVQVLELQAQGLTTRQIAEALNLSVKTIETYQIKLKDKLGLDNNNQLTRWAVYWEIERA